MSTASAPAIDNAAIIARGYALDEEYNAIQALNKLEKLNFGTRDPNNATKQTDVEGIWAYALEDSSVSGNKFHFVFFNDPVFTRGPRPIAGLVGVATSYGPNERARAYSDDCVEMFKKTGQPAIDYYHQIRAKYEAEEAAKKEKEKANG